MEITNQFIINTPFWVWVLLVYLIVRGIKARKPASTTLVKIATLPVLFTLIGFCDLFLIYPLNLTTSVSWCAGIIFGACVGWYMIEIKKITINKKNKTIHRPADYTLLPLILLTFIVKYCLGAINFIKPALIHNSLFSILFLVLYGFFTGIFIGKFSKYYSIWRAA